MKYLAVFLVLAVFSSVPSVYADGNSIDVPFAEIRPAIDGKFTSNTEWADANVTSYNSDGIEFYLLTKQDRNFVYIMLDGVDFQTDPKKEDVSVRYQTTLCFDGDNNAGSKRESGDFCHTSTIFNEFGKEVRGENAPVKFNADGESSHLDLPNKFKTGWSFGSNNDPFTKSDHLIFEVKIPRTLFESLDDVGFAFEMYAGSSPTDLVQLTNGIVLPPESDKKNPSTWGKLVLPEIGCPNLELVFKYDGSPACVKHETKQKLVDRGWTETEFDKNKMVKIFQNSPETREFYAVYDGADMSVSEDHVSYFAGSEDGYLAKMNMFFDKNNALDHIEFHCYFQKTHRFELAQEDIVSKLKKYDCREITKAQEPSPEPMSDIESQLYDARKSLKGAYQNHVNLGPYYMKDVVVGFGTYDDTLIIDIPSKYTDQNSIKIIKEEIRHIVGNQVKIDYAVYDESVGRHIETVIPYLWNKILHQNKIDFAPKEGGYFNHADGFAQHDRVCSPLVAPNGTEFFISSTFNLEPFEVTGTFIDKTKPDDCHKIWKTEVIMQEPDRVTALWLENEN